MPKTNLDKSISKEKYLTDIRKNPGSESVSSNISSESPKNGEIGLNSEDYCGESSESGEGKDKDRDKKEKIKQKNQAKAPKSFFFKLNLGLTTLVIAIFGFYFGCQMYVKKTESYPKIENVYVSPSSKQLIIQSDSINSATSIRSSDSAYNSSNGSNDASNSSSSNSNNSPAGQESQNQQAQNSNQAQNQVLQNSNIDYHNQESVGINSRLREIGLGYKQSLGNYQNNSESIKQVQIIPQK